MQTEIHRLEEEIKKADTSKLAPPLNETELIQQLVLQFLQHDGYVDTARAFASEIQAEKQALCLDPNEKVPGIDIKDDEDANNRQREFFSAQHSLFIILLTHPRHPSGHLGG